MSKTLSNGTLGLRFMQNAQRGKNPSEAKHEKGGPADDAEWHVPQNVRDTWSSDGPSLTNSNSSEVSEQSYLPFLFRAEDKASPQFKGRRSFVHGKEVIPQPEPVQSSDSPQSPVTKLESDSVSGEAGAGRSHRDVGLIKPKKEKKPVSISGFKSSVPATSSSNSRLPGKKPILPASSLIYQDADVGVDFASTRRAASHGTGFIKPADVEAPPQLSQPPRKPVVDTVVESDVVEQKKRTKDSPTQLTGVPEDSSRKKRKR